MLDRGSSLGVRWHLDTVPSIWEAGALATVIDETGVRRDVLVLGAFAQGAVTDPGQRAATWAGRALDVSRECHVAGGFALEVLGATGYRTASARFAAMHSTTTASARVGTLAADFAGVADDLAALHAQGLAHGAIAPWMLLSRDADGAPVQLAGFGLAALTRSAGTASDDVAALLSTFLGLVDAHADEMSRSAREAIGSPPATARDLAAALRTLAASSGGPYRDATTRAPLFPSEVYREHPVELPTGGKRSDSPGLFSEMTPRDWRLLVRVGGFAFTLVLGLVLFMVRSVSQSGPPIQSTRIDEPRTPLESALEHGRHPQSCRGEPLAPVSSVALPGAGALESMAAWCGEGALRVMVHRGTSVWLLSRGSTTGLPWDPAYGNSEVADTVLTLSRPAPTDDGSAFAAWITVDHRSIGVAHFGLPVRVQIADVAHLDDATSLVALGGTARYAYLATTIGRPGSQHVMLVRMLRDDTSADARGDTFDAGPGVALSVWPDTLHPTVLVAGAAIASPRLVRAITLDLARLDALDASTHALPATAQTASGDVSIPAAYLAAAPSGIAADLGNGTHGPTRFALALADTLNATGPCEGVLLDQTCVRVRETRMLTVAATPVLGPALDNVGIPIALSTRIGGADLLVRGGPTALLRTAVDNDGRAEPAAAVVTPSNAPGTTIADATDCGGNAWFVFAGNTVAEPGIAALPTSCIR